MIKTHGAGTLRADHVGSSVTLGGWVNAHRDHGGVLFVDVRDASGVVQVVCEGEVDVECEGKRHGRNSEGRVAQQALLVGQEQHEYRAEPRNGNVSSFGSST